MKAISGKTFERNVLSKILAELFASRTLLSGSAYSGSWQNPSMLRMYILYYNGNKEGFYKV